MNEFKELFKFKITVVGDGQVGKTSLIKKFTKGTFKKDYLKTVGAHFTNYDKEINGDKIRLIFWDIAGQDDFNFLRPSFYKESKAAIIVCSLENNKLGKRSFEHIQNWHDNIKKYCGNIPIVLFANKVDLIKEDSLDKMIIEEVLKELNLLGYFLTSAKTGKRVLKAFNSIIHELYNKYREL